METIDKAVIRWSRREHALERLEQAARDVHQSRLDLEHAGEMDDDQAARLDVACADIMESADGIRTAQR